METEYIYSINANKKNKKTTRSKVFQKNNWVQHPSGYSQHLEKKQTKQTMPNVCFVLTYSYALALLTQIHSGQQRGD